MNESEPTKDELNDNVDAQIVDAARKRVGRKGKPELRFSREPKFFKVARLAAYTCAVSLGVAAVASAAAYGDMKQTALQLGSELGSLEDVATDGRPLMINGQPIYMTSTIENMPWEEVLDRIEANCEQNSTGLKEQMKDLSSVLKKAPDALMDSADVIMREDDDERGVVTCFVDEDGSRKGKSIVKRLSEFGRTGDMSNVGDIRYVFAEESSPGHSHVIAIWTEGPFNLYSFFPENGKDTPGYDPPGAARPADSTRLLTVGAEGMPYGTWMYESRLSLNPMFESLDDDMNQLGWSLAIGDLEHNRRRVYRKGGLDMIVSTVPNEGKTMVSMIRMGED